MTKHTRPDTPPLLELNFTAPVAVDFAATSAVPDEIEILPRGPQITGRDGRVFRISDPEAFAAAYNASDDAKAVIDINHASEDATPGVNAPAMGWIEEMSVRDGVVVGRVKWSAGGRMLMEAQAYRYVSPAILVNRETREIAKLTSVGLVHRPNLPLKALNSRNDDNEETDQMDKAIAEALGLAANATTADAVVAIGRMKDAQETALNAAQRPDPERFVPKADYDLVLNRAESAEGKLKDTEEAALNRAAETTVDALVADGKIAPASRELQIETCKQIGVEKFQKLWDLQPRAITPGKTAPAKTPDGKGTPDAAVLEVCRMFGSDPETHMAFAAKDKEA